MVKVGSCYMYERSKKDSDEQHATGRLAQRVHLAAPQPSPSSPPGYRGQTKPASRETRDAESLAIFGHTQALEKLIERGAILAVHPMLSAFCAPPMTATSAGAFLSSVPGDLLVAPASRTVVGARIPAHRRGKDGCRNARCSLHAETDNVSRQGGKSQSSRRSLLTLALLGVVTSFPRETRADDSTQDTQGVQKVRVTDVAQKVKQKAAKKVSEAQSGGVAGVSVSVVKQTVRARPLSRKHLAETLPPILQGRPRLQCRLYHHSPQFSRSLR